VEKAQDVSVGNGNSSAAAATTSADADTTDSELNDDLMEQVLFIESAL